MYWQCDQPKELCLLLADPRLCFIENRLGRNAKKRKKRVHFYLWCFCSKRKILRQHIFVYKWMLYYEILPKVEQISEYLFTYLVTQCLTRKVGAGMFCHFAYGEMCSGF